ncbi:MAG: ATP-binding cassette domain-containing protein [Ilumatobacteraceae bacterium]
MFKQGYQTAIEGSGIETVGEQAVPDWDNAQGGVIFEQLLTAAGGAIDGVLVANDGLSLAAQAVLADAGLTVPTTGQDATCRGSAGDPAGHPVHDGVPSPSSRRPRVPSRRPSSSSRATRSARQRHDRQRQRRDPVRAGSGPVDFIDDVVTVIEDGFVSVEDARDRSKTLHGGWYHRRLSRRSDISLRPGCPPGPGRLRVVTRRRRDGGDDHLWSSGRSRVAGRGPTTADYVQAQPAVRPQSGGHRTVTDAPILEAHGVNKSFGPVHVLHDVDFRVYPGTVTALIGDNGAGKTTLIKCITGIYPVDSGEFRFEGKPVHVSGPKDVAELGIEVVYQDLALCENLDIVQNLFLGRERLKYGLLDEPSMEQAARDTLASLSVRTVKSVRQKVSSLSGGQRQTVAIAKAVLWNSKVVLLDEPTAALGVAQTKQVLDLVRRLADAGLGVVLISHNMNDVLQVSDRVCAMYLGRASGRRPDHVRRAS